ncbi:hypothetical protein FXO37_07916 [Capsicum annuum]|nr:hypothetical protein FXO37_07916 [Capsicum annuum]
MPDWRGNPPLILLPFSDFLVGLTLAIDSVLSIVRHYFSAFPVCLCMRTDRSVDGISGAGIVFSKEPTGLEGYEPPISLFFLCLWVKAGRNQRFKALVELRSECKSDKKETKLRCRNLVCVVRISFFPKREYLLSLFQSDKFKLLRQSRSLSSRFIETVSVFCGRSSKVAIPTSRASTKAGEILIYCCGFSNRRGIESLDTGALSYLGLVKGQSHSAVT